MKVIFNEAETKRVVEEYYRNERDFDGALLFSCKIDTYGGRMIHNPLVILDMVMSGTLKVASYEKNVEVTVSQEEVINIFSARIEQDGDYTVKNAILKYGELEEDGTRKWYQQLIPRYGFIGLEVELESKKLVRK